MVLRLIRDLPGDEFLLPPSPRGLDGTSNPVGPNAPPRGLASTTDAWTTRLRRPQQRRSSRAPLSIAHEFDLALRSHAHTTSSRPPHPAPRFVTIGRNAPLHRGGMRENVPVICPTGQAKYFSREGWTGILQANVICPSGNGFRRS